MSVGTGGRRRRNPSVSEEIDCGLVVLGGTGVAERVKVSAAMCYDEIEKYVIQNEIPMKGLRVTVEVVE